MLEISGIAVHQTPSQEGFSCMKSVSEEFVHHRSMSVNMKYRTPKLTVIHMNPQQENDYFPKPASTILIQFQ
jgi:hypothetical protein